jgi:hypothetical protein
MISQFRIALLFVFGEQPIGALAARSSSDQNAVAVIGRVLLGRLLVVGELEAIVGPPAAALQVVADEDYPLAVRVAAIPAVAPFRRPSRILVFVSRTATSHQPASGSVNMKILAVPARSYS